MWATVRTPIAAAESVSRGWTEWGRGWCLMPLARLITASKVRSAVGRGVR